MAATSTSHVSAEDVSDRPMAVGVLPARRFGNPLDHSIVLDPAAAASPGATAVSHARAEMPGQPAADFPAVFDLATLDGSNGFRMAGIEMFDRSGSSVSSAGDVNGDGFDDVLVGADAADPDGVSQAGEVYVVFGSGAGFAEKLDLSSLDGTNGFRLQGIDVGDQSGCSVASAGDVNGDGFDDIIIGAFLADSSGEAYVVFGSGAGFAASIDLATLDGSNGFRLGGTEGYDRVGRSVASAGDINGDGFDDVIIGGWGGSDPGGDRYFGDSYVVFGSDAGFAASIDLPSLDGTDGFRLRGVDAYDRSGRSVSSAGDFNNDGFGDVIVGAPFADADGSRDTGESYIVFGSSAGFAASIDLATLDGTNGFRIDGVDTNDFSGQSVAAAGDVNGDGFDDVVIGAWRADSGGDNKAGESYVVFGSRAGFAASFDLSSLDGSNGFRLGGIDAYDQCGFAVASAGDVNGDGFDDVIVGAFYGDSDGGRNAGESYVVFGSGAGFAASIDLATLDGTNGFRLDGVDTSDLSGGSVSSAGDVNGDGFDDIIIGAPLAGPNAFSDAGESYVVFGRAPDEVVRRVGSAADQEIRGGDFDDTLAGRGGDDLLVGAGGDDRLFGGLGRVRVQGGEGDDRLRASRDGDRLTGGMGADLFALDDDLAPGGHARITDFASGTDRFAIDASDFGGGLTPGALDPDAFVVNTNGRAGDADDRFIYNSENGRLFYDIDGSGAGERVLIAILNDAPTVTAGDFIVV